jgi:hypothetical protein
MLEGECPQTKIEQEAMMPTLNVPASSETPVPGAAASTATPAAPALDADDAAVGCSPPLASSTSSDAQAPHDGDHNQGGARPAGLEYQRELGTEQDA